MQFLLFFTNGINNIQETMSKFIFTQMTEANSQPSKENETWEPNPLEIWCRVRAYKIKNSMFESCNRREIPCTTIQVASLGDTVRKKPQINYKVYHRYAFNKFCWKLAEETMVNNYWLNPYYLFYAPELYDLSFNYLERFLSLMKIGKY